MSPGLSVRSLAASLRIRLVVILAIAAVPLLVMAGVISAQNYLIGVGEAEESAILAREAAVSRFAGVLEGAEQMLAALSQSPQIRAGGAACSAYLRDVLELQGERYANISVMDPDGAVTCLARDSPARGVGVGANYGNQYLFRRVIETGAPAMGRLTTSPITGERVLGAAYPVRVDGAVTAVLYTGMRIDRLALGAGSLSPDRPAPDAQSAVWLADVTGGMSGVSGAPDHALPNPPVLQRLLAEPDQVIEGHAVRGDPYIYASASLPGGMRLLLGYRAVDAQATARHMLLERMGELGLLTLAGLLAVAIGVNRAVVRPLKRLTRAVRGWRGGGAFDPGESSTGPSELAELSQAFSQATGALAEREAQLRGVLSQQDLLMQEIHHRVKNNLQIVASLLNLQASRIRQPQARAEFQSARDRVRALATLHRHLYSYGELHTINMRSFLIELCGQLFQAMGETEGERIHLEIDAPELQMRSDQAVPLALIVTELVSNAVKYAFPDGRTGTIGVRLTSGEESVRLVVWDDGAGLAAVRAAGMAEGDGREGIGLQLIRGFVRQLDATLDVRDDHGTRYELDIPRHPRRRDEEAEPEPQRTDPQPVG